MPDPPGATGLDSGMRRYDQSLIYLQSIDHKKPGGSRVFCGLVLAFHNGQLQGPSLRLLRRTTAASLYSSGLPRAARAF